MVLATDRLSEEDKDLLREFERKESWTDAELSDFIRNQIAPGDSDRITRFFKAVNGDTPLLEDIVKYIKMSYFVDVIDFFDKKSPNMVGELLGRCSRYEDSWIILERVKAVRKQKLFDMVFSTETTVEVDKVLKRWRLLDMQRKKESSR